MCLPSTWWQNWVAEVKIKGFEVRQVGDGVQVSAFTSSVTSGKLLYLSICKMGMIITLVSWVIMKIQRNGIYQVPSRFLSLRVSLIKKLPWLFTFIIDISNLTQKKKFNIG